MPRTLSLRTEHLTALGSGELAAVAGGAVTYGCIPTQVCTGYYPSIFDPCVTLACAQTA